MNNAYYQQKQLVAQVSQKDNIIGKIERWRAHKEGILHRGFTTILMYNGRYLLQQRKHIVFDKFWDFTFSSHQLYENGLLESDLDAIYRSLLREWDLDRGDLIETPVALGKIYYKAKDLKSIYTEHEFDYIYLAKLKKMPSPNLNFSYRFELIPTVAEITKLPASYILAPWVTQIIKSLPLATFDNKYPKRLD